MGKQAWNLVFRNTAGTACSLRGWPGVVVRTPAGQTVRTRIGDVSFNNLAAVADAQVILGPGRSAVVTAMSPTAPPGCVSEWKLELTLPGAGGPVTVRQPASSVARCVGGRLQLSPFYPEQTLARQVRQLHVSASPPPFPAAQAPEPPVCTAAALRTGVVSVTSGHGGSIIELRLANAGSTCVLPDGWPTVRLGEASGASQVAKLFTDTAALQADRPLLTTYRRGTAQVTALTLRDGQSVSVAVLVPAPGPAGCGRLTSITVYPSAVATASSTATATSIRRMPTITRTRPVTPDAD